jgi:hypothetical protein
MGARFGCRCTSHIIIDVQKKVAALLGNPIPEPDPEDKS